MSLSIGFSSKHYIRVILGIVLFFIGVGELVVRLFVVPVPNTTPHLIDAVYTRTNRNVVVGDSHIYRSFISSDYFLNLGMGGSTIPMMKIVIEEYFRHRNPGEVIVEASPQLLSSGYIDRNTQGYDTYFTQNNRFPIKAYIFEPGIGGWIKNIHTLSDIKQLIKDRKLAEYHSNIQSNWLNVPKTLRTLKVQKRIEEHEPNIQGSQKTIESYKELVNFLVNKGAKVCLLRTPVNEEYLEAVINKPFYLKSTEIFKDISKVTGVRYVDFRKLNYSFTPDKYIDQDHISPKTSIQFEKLVRKSCFGNSSHLY